MKKKKSLDNEIEQAVRATVEELTRGADRKTYSFYLNQGFYKEFQQICDQYEIGYSHLIDIFIKNFVSIMSKK